MVIIGVRNLHLNEKCNIAIEIVFKILIYTGDDEGLPPILINTVFHDERLYSPGLPIKAIDDWKRVIIHFNNTTTSFAK